jgi:hypothetical protein
MLFNDTTADPSHAPAPASPQLAITWVSTAFKRRERKPIRKVCTRRGPWEVTDGARAPAFAFERVSYDTLKAAMQDIHRRARERVWAIAVGAPHPDLDLQKLHACSGGNFIDLPEGLLLLDFNGFTPGDGQDLSTPESFGEPIIDALRSRLPKALGRATFELLSTASTGLYKNARGEPAYGCASFRLAFALDRSLTLAEQKRVAEAISRLPGFGRLDVYGKRGQGSCINTQIYSPANLLFVA